jgi:hypothetical protein
MALLVDEKRRRREMAISRKVDIADIFLGTKRGGFGRDVGCHKDGVSLGIVLALPVQSQNGVPDESRFPGAFALNEQSLLSAANLEVGNEVDVGILLSRLPLKASFEKWDFVQEGAEHLLGLILKFHLIYDFHRMV